MDDILLILLNPIFLGGVTFCLILAIVFMFLRRAKPRTEVLYFRERDRRGQTFIVKDETAQTLNTTTKGLLSPSGKKLSFIKVGGSFVFREGSKMVTRFLAKEGSAYTTKSAGSQTEKIPLSTTLKGLWGEAFYKQIPEEQRRKAEDGTVFVTVDLVEGRRPEGFAPFGEEDLDDEKDRRAAQALGEGLKTGTSRGRELINAWLWFAFGLMVILLLIQLRVIQINNTGRVIVPIMEQLLR